jgi:hypothetical protein
MAMPAPVAIFNLLQFLALVIGEVGSYLLVRFRHDLVDTPASVSSALLELCRRLIDDRRNLGHLFGGQIELRAKPFLHSNAYQFRMVKFQETMLRTCSRRRSPIRSGIP